MSTRCKLENCVARSFNGIYPHGRVTAEHRICGVRIVAMRCGRAGGGKCCCLGCDPRCETKAGVWTTTCWNAKRSLDVRTSLQLPRYAASEHRSWHHSATAVRPATTPVEANVLVRRGAFAAFLPNTCCSLACTDLPCGSIDRRLSRPIAAGTLEPQCSSALKHVGSALCSNNPASDVRAVAILRGDEEIGSSHSTHRVDTWHAQICVMGSMQS